MKNKIKDKSGSKIRQVQHPVVKVWGKAQFLVPHQEKFFCARANVHVAIKRDCDTGLFTLGLH